MASRKAEKEAARAQREALERQQQAAALRRRRLYGLAAVIAAAVVVVVGAIIVSSSGGGDSGATGIVTGTTANENVSEVTTLLDGIPQSGNQLGKSSAPVSMDYYGDLECPICRDFTLGGLPQIIQTYVRSGKLKIHYRSLQTATRDATTFQTQQTAALAAGQQRRLWQFIELFYRQQSQEGTPYVTESYLQGIAKQVPGMKLATWKTDRQDPKLAGVLTTDSTAAQTAGASGTPTLVITGPNGTKTLEANVSFADASQAIQAVS